LQNLQDLLLNHSKGLIVCGPQQDEHFSEAVITLAKKFRLPVLADPLSQVRTNIHAKDVVVEGYDAIFRNEEIRKALQPEFIIRFGAMPVSKMYLFFVQQHKGV